MFGFGQAPWIEPATSSTRAATKTTENFFGVEMKIKLNNTALFF